MAMGISLAAATGVIAGALHTFSGPDHLSALAPVAVEHPERAARTGAVWGLGHGIGTMLLGLVGLWLREFVDIDSVAGWAEFIVGFLLVGIGVRAMWVARRMKIHEHEHKHENGVGTHSHVHDHRSGRLGHSHVVLGLGVFHGVAGGGYLFGVLPALALPTYQAIIYLMAYVAGSVVAMSAFASGVGKLARKSVRWIRELMFLSGALATAIGGVWIVTTWRF